MRWTHAHLLAATALAGALTVGALAPTEAAAAKPKPKPAQSWTSTADQSATFRHTPKHRFTKKARRASEGPMITVKRGRTAQTYAGAGASMTESSAALIGGLPPATRTRLLGELFGPQGLRLNLLRQPLGSSDFVATRLFSTYQDIPGLFDYSRDLITIAPLIRAAQALNPSLTLGGAPWSAPAWMKSSGSLFSGTLRSDSVGKYATYLATVAQAYARAGMPLVDLSIQNEPGHEAGYPTMRLSAAQQAAVLRETDRQLAARGLSTRLWAYDHNWDGVGEALSVLAAVRNVPRVVGAAFHCYAGDPSAMARVRAAGWRVRETECSGTDSDDPRRTYSDTLLWQTHYLVMEGLRHGSESLMLWNLALNQNGGPSFGSCGTRCNGVVQIRNGGYTRNAEWVVLGQVSRFVRPGAKVLRTAAAAQGVENVAFRNPDGSTVMVLLNLGSRATKVVIKDRKRYARVTVPASGVTSVTWR